MDVRLVIHRRWFSTIVKKPPGYWKDPFNQKDFLISISKVLNVNKYDDWYNVSYRDIIRQGGYGLLTYIGYAEAIMKAFPEHDWKIWKFSKVPPKFWENKSNHRLYFDQIAKTLNISKLDDWYAINSEDIIQNGGSGLLSTYNNSLIKALASVYPEYNWKRWKFQRVPIQEWKGNLAKEFLEDLGNKLGVSKLQDWYYVTPIHIKEYGGSGLLTAFGDSMYEILKTIFPNEEWVIWRLERLPPGYWNDIETVNKAIRWAEGYFNIRNPEDWYSVTSTQLEKVGFTTLLQKYGGMNSLLKKFYPSYPWDFSKSVRYKIQGIMITHILALFPKMTDIQVDYAEESLRYKETNKKMQFDVFIPSLHLAFEYQGIQHYDNHFLMPFETQKLRDQEKRKACEKAGITLIEVPFWWDQQKESLAATIHEKRPDLIPNKGIGNPISEFPIKIKNQDKKKEKEISDFYHLAVGSKSGNVPKCRTCSHEFADRNELRVVVGAKFSHSGSSYKGNVSICAKTSCLNNLNIPTKINPDFERFEGKIFVPKDLENRLNEINKLISEGVVILKHVN